VTGAMAVLGRTPEAEPGPQGTFGAEDRVGQPDPIAIEAHYARFYAFHAHVPEVEVHEDPGLTWMKLPVPRFLNGGVVGALYPEEAEARLRGVAARFDEHGAGFWVGPGAPDGTESALKRLGFRCRKRFPGLRCAVAAPWDERPEAPVTVGPIEDHARFGPHDPHPYAGPVNTAIRRFEIRRRAALVGARPPRVVELGATDPDGQLVGACLVFVDLEQEMGSLHDVVVLEPARRRGIGAALVSAAVEHVRASGCSWACLISTAMGESVYRRCGFEEVARIAYWYRKG
jgi:GNAT superfamily N-acetyltransferase